MGLTSRTLGGAVGSCEVVGVRVGLCVGGGGLLRVAARSTLGDGLVASTLGSGVAGIRGRSTLGDGRRCRRILLERWQEDISKLLDGVGSRDGLTGGRWDCPAKGGECVRPSPG